MCRAALCLAFHSQPISHTSESAADIFAIMRASYALQHTCCLLVATTPYAYAAVCLPGFGRASCAECAVGTWSAGGNVSTPSPACQPCPSGKTTLAARSISDASCSGDSCLFLRGVGLFAWSAADYALCSKRSVAAPYPGNSWPTSMQPRLNGFLKLCYGDGIAANYHRRHHNQPAMSLRLLSTPAVCLPGATAPECQGAVTCPQGQYSSGPSCLSCPTGFTTLGPGAESMAECTGARKGVLA